MLFLLFLTTLFYVFFFFFQAEDGIRDLYVTGVQTCALPILPLLLIRAGDLRAAVAGHLVDGHRRAQVAGADQQKRHLQLAFGLRRPLAEQQIGRASCRERGWISGGSGLIQRRSRWISDAWVE